MVNWKGLRVSLIAEAEDFKDLQFADLVPSKEDASGVEIIPLEPEQRSYLRREAPSIVPLSPLLREQIHV